VGPEPQADDRGDRFKSEKVMALAGAAVAYPIRSDAEMVNDRAPPVAAPTSDAATPPEGILLGEEER
jgi:hypothetical protein